MPWPWEYDPETSDGGGRVTQSDRRRMALKYGFLLVGVGVLIVELPADEPVPILSLAAGVALAGASLVDLAWLRKGDYDHTILRDRNQALLTATVLALLGSTLVAIGLSA